MSKRLLNELYKYRKFQNGGLSVDNFNINMEDLQVPDYDMEQQRQNAIQSQAEGQFKPETPMYDPADDYPIEPLNDYSKESSMKLPEIKPEIKPEMKQKLDKANPMTIDRAIAQAARKKDERVQFYNKKREEATTPAEELVATVIAQTESSYGKNRKHRRIKKGLNKNHQAAGDYGLMPLTIKDIFNKDKKLQELYPEIYKLSQKVKKNKRKDADILTAALNDNHEASYKIAVSEFNRVLNAFDGDVEHALNAWFYGVTGTKRKYKKGERIPTKSTRHLEVYRKGARDPSSIAAPEVVPQFEEGGFMDEEEDFMPDQSFQNPTPPASKQDLLSVYQAEKEQYKKDKEEARKKQMMIKMLDTIGRTARKAGSGYAQMKGGLDMGYKEEAPMEIPTIEELGVEKPKTLDEAIKLAKIKSTLAKSSISGNSNKQNDPNSEESKALQKQLHTIRPDIPKERLEKMSAFTIKKTMRTLARNEVAQLKLKQEREKRLSEKQAWQFSEKDEFSDKQVESLTALDTIRTQLQRIKELKKEVSTGGYPAVKGLYKDATAKWLGTPKGKYGELQSLVGDNLSDLVRSKSGLTVSDKEAERLAKVVPNLDMPDEDFDAVMKQFERTLNDIYRIRLKNLKKFQGKVPAEQYKRYELIKSNNVIKIRQKATGKTKSVNEETAKRLLKSDKFERVD